MVLHYQKILKIFYLFVYALLNTEPSVHVMSMVFDCYSVKTTRLRTMHVIS